MTGSLAKVSDIDPPGTVHWVELWAARNEFESFQVHVQGLAVADEVTVRVGDLLDRKSGYRIAASDRVVVSRQLYLQIPKDLPSDAHGRTGAIPDPLIPARDPYVHELRRAFPAPVLPGKNVSAWVDVHVPADAPSGYYEGEVTVELSKGGTTRLPVVLGVWAHTLPSTASLATVFGSVWHAPCLQEFGSYEACGRAVPSGDPDEAVDYFHDVYARFALDHRVSLATSVYAWPKKTNDWSHFDRTYGPLLDGTANTRLAGARLTHLQYVGDPLDFAAVGKWADHFRDKGWLPQLVYYHCDEPALGLTCTFPEARAELSGVRRVAQDLRTLLTATYGDATSHDLVGLVDVLTPPVARLDPIEGPGGRSDYDSYLAGAPERRVYFYQSCTEHESCDNGKPGKGAVRWPSYMVDASPVRNRVFQWVAYRLRVSGELYYLTDLCFVVPCGPKGAETMDPFVSVYAHGGHGDGTLYYPGRVEVIGGTRPIPLSSIRFELLREGMEDFEMLMLLDAQGDRAFAEAAVGSIVRAAHDFDDDPDKLMQARFRIGQRLHDRAWQVASP